MNDKLFIPKKIKVGYQTRTDTYSQRLGFVIYYNAKGQLAQEKSWKGWIQDEPIMEWVYDAQYNRLKDETTGEYLQTEKSPALPTHEFDNIPTEGFVLNKKVGGTNSGWNYRQTKCRVYDPRGFEFEIDLINLLFILQETNSYKGKGLEGEFVYSWSGKDIVLLPCSSQDYQSSAEFTKLKGSKVSAKSMIPGATYYTKDMTNVVYIGKYVYMGSKGWRHRDEHQVEHIFLTKNEEYIHLKVNQLANLVDENPVSNYAELVEGYQKTDKYMPFQDVYIKDLEVKASDYYINDKWNHYGNLNGILLCNRALVQIDHDTFENYSIHYAYKNERIPNKNYDPNFRSSWNNNYNPEFTDKTVFNGIKLTRYPDIKIVNDKIVNDGSGKTETMITVDELHQMKFKELFFMDSDKKTMKKFI